MILNDSFMILSIIWERDAYFAANMHSSHSLPLHRLQNLVYAALLNNVYSLMFCVKLRDDRIFLDKTVAEQVSMWKSKKGLSDTVVADHACSGETCSYYQIGDVFICEKTGLVHGGKHYLWQSFSVFHFIASFFFFFFIVLYWSVLVLIIFFFSVR